MANFVDCDAKIYQQFAQRTLTNLRHVWKQAQEYERLKKEDPALVKELPELFEVTQLINCMLGILVFPSERVINQIKEVPIEEHEQAQKFVIRKDNYFDEKCDNLRILVKRLRNGVAHFRVEFPEDKEYITEIQVGDKYKDDPDLRWEATIRVFDLYCFVVAFAEGIDNGTLLVEEQKTS